jgi:hypothetical protein
MNTLTFLANIADTVGVPATNWDARAIIFLKLLAVVSLVLLNGFFVASEFVIVKVRASCGTVMKRSHSFEPIRENRSTAIVIVMPRGVVGSRKSDQ